MTTESQQARAKRHRQRLLFDAVADLYGASRPQYPEGVVDYLVHTAQLGITSRVLEVGCGSGQLTRQLAARGFALTAIDIGPSMVAAAQRRIGGGAVDFQAVSFERFGAAESSFDLVVSADAFHWIDRDVRFAKSACLLRRRGWLGVLSLVQVYDEPLRTTLQRMWVKRSADGGAWLKQPGPTPAEAIGDSGYFDAPITWSVSARLSVPQSFVVGLESTRATALDWEEGGRLDFTEELRGHLDDSVGLTQVTTVTMAQIARRP